MCVHQGTCSCSSCSLQARDSNFGLKSLTLLPNHQGTLCSFLSCSDFLMSSSFQLPVPSSNLLTRCRHQMLCFGLWALVCMYLTLSARPLLRKGPPCSALVGTISKPEACPEPRLVPTVASAFPSDQGNSCARARWLCLTLPSVEQQPIFPSVAIIMVCIYFQRYSKNGIMGRVWVEGPWGNERSS